MRSTLLLAVLIGLASVFGGLTIAYYGDLPPGGTVVLIAAGAFAVTSALAAARGRLSRA
jgi:zinc transport system permease protein